MRGKESPSLIGGGFCMKKMITILLASALVLGLLITGLWPQATLDMVPGSARTQEHVTRTPMATRSVTTTAAIAPMWILMATVCATIWARTAARGHHGGGHHRGGRWN